MSSNSPPTDADFAKSDEFNKGGVIQFKRSCQYCNAPDTEFALVHRHHHADGLLDRMPNQMHPLKEFFALRKSLSTLTGSNNPYPEVAFRNEVFAPLLRFLEITIPRKEAELIITVWSKSNLDQVSFMEHIIGHLKRGNIRSARFNESFIRVETDNPWEMYMESMKQTQNWESLPESDLRSTILADLHTVSPHFNFPDDKQVSRAQDYCKKCGTIVRTYYPEVEKYQSDIEQAHKEWEEFSQPIEELHELIHSACVNFNEKEKEEKRVAAQKKRTAAAEKKRIAKIEKLENELKKLKKK